MIKTFNPHHQLISSIKLCFTNECGEYFKPISNPSIPKHVGCHTQIESGYFCKLHLTRNTLPPISMFRRPDSLDHIHWLYEHRTHTDETYFRLFCWTIFVQQSRTIVFTVEWYCLFRLDELLKGINF